MFTTTHKFQFGIYWTHANDSIVNYQHEGPSGRTHSTTGIFLHNSCRFNNPFLRSIANCILDIYTKESLQVYVRLLEGVRNGICFKQQVLSSNQLSSLLAIRSFNIYS